MRVGCNLTVLPLESKKRNRSFVTSPVKNKDKDKESGRRNFIYRPTTIRKVDDIQHAVFLSRRAQSGLLKSHKDKHGVGPTTRWVLSSVFGRRSSSMRWPYGVTFPANGCFSFSFHLPTYTFLLFHSHTILFRITTVISKTVLAPDAMTASIKGRQLICQKRSC